MNCSLSLVRHARSSRSSTKHRFLHCGKNERCSRIMSGSQRSTLFLWNVFLDSFHILRFQFSFCSKDRKCGHGNRPAETVYTACLEFKHKNHQTKEWAYVRTTEASKWLSLSLGWGHNKLQYCLNACTIYCSVLFWISFSVYNFF